MLNVAVGIMTYNSVSSLRTELLEGTLRSAITAFPGSPVGIFDIGSTDGSAELEFALSLKPDGTVCEPPDCSLVADEVQSSPGEEAPITTIVGRPHLLRARDGNHTPGAGRLLMMQRILRTSPQVMVLSDDDMLWKPGAHAKLTAFWSEAPDDIVLVSGFLEPVWDWNTPRETVEYGGVKALVRDSAPGCAWSFRLPHTRMIASVIERAWGYDYKACVALRERGLRVAQLDLADHAGWDHSTHGNEAIKDGRPLDRAKWGI